MSQEGRWSTRDYGEAVRTWERRSAWPMLFLALVSVVILVWEIIVAANTQLANAAIENTLFLADLAIMVVFAVEFAYRISLVEKGNRIPYVLAHPIDVVVVLIIGLQPLRLLRSARAIRTLRAVRTITMVGKGSKQSAVAVTKDRMVHALTIVVIATAAGAYALAFFEGPDEADRFEATAEAFWWSISTITTMGGFDPTTVGGRVVALALTVVGLIVVAALAGTISAFFVETSPARESPAADADTTITEGEDR